VNYLEICLARLVGGRRTAVQANAHGYDHKEKYGDDVKWPNVAWITIGILCVCGLVVLLFIR
jgi:hypothetical protein